MKTKSLSAIFLGTGLGFIWLCALFNHINRDSNFDIAAGFSAAIALILSIGFGVYSDK